MIQHQRRAHGEEGTEQSGSPGAQEGAENGSPTSKEGPELPTHPAAPTERSQAAQLSPPSPHPQMWHFWLWMQRRGAARSIVALRSVAQCGAGGCKGGKGLQRETPPPPSGVSVHPGVEQQPLLRCTSCRVSAGAQPGSGSTLWLRHRAHSRTNGAGLRDTERRPGRELSTACGSQAAPTSQPALQILPSPLHPPTPSSCSQPMEWGRARAAMGARRGTHRSAGSASPRTAHPGAACLWGSGPSTSARSRSPLCKGRRCSVSR